MRRAFENKPARTGVKPLVVFPDHDKINVLRRLVFERAEALVVKFDRAQIDVLFQLEAQAEQNSLFQNARLDLGMADGAEEDGGKLAQLLHHAVRQRLLGAQITLAAQVVGRCS